MSAFDLAEARAVLTRTPGTLEQLLSGLPEAWVRATEGPGTWSPFDVVGHLIHGEETDWLPRLRIILAEGAARPFPTFDRFAMLGKSKGRSLADLLVEFRARRTESLLALDRLALTPAQHALPGLHPSLGPVTLAQLLATWVVHDLGHIAQVTRVMAKRYRDEVGPWREYLPVLDR